MVNMCPVEQRRNVLLLSLTLLILIVNLTASTNAEGSSLRQRRSGISDQRLAELETLYALSNMRGKPATHPVAYGLIDPARIGKRKRSFYLADPSEMNRKYNMDFLLQVLRRLSNRPDLSEVNNENTENADQ